MGFCMPMYEGGGGRGGGGGGGGRNCSELYRTE